MGRTRGKVGQSHKVVAMLLLSCFLVLYPPATINYSLASHQYYASAQENPSAYIALGYPFKLGIGQTAHYIEEDVQVRMMGVTEDSRCPSDVQCIWAGQISILLELANISDGSVIGQLTLTKMGMGNGGNHTLSNTTLGGYLVGLDGVSPYPVSTSQIEPSDYVATLILLNADDANLQAIIPSSPVAVDPVSRSRVDSLTIGHETIVAMALHNNLAEEKRFVSILEVRGLEDGDGDGVGGITHFLALESGAVAPGSWLNVGQPWTPSQPGSYQLRTFLVDSLDIPHILSPIKLSEISVNEGSPTDSNGGGGGGGGDGTMTSGNVTGIIDGNNRFALDFYSEVATRAADGSGNAFFSPWSITTAFALVNEGARGTTAEEIESVFGFPPDEDARRNSFTAIQGHLNDNLQGNYTLSTANAVWVREGYRLSDEYARAATQYYGSEVSNVVFTTEEGRSRINDWVEGKTGGKIMDLIPPGVLNDLTRLVTTNAVYFKGTWVTQFDKGDTVEQDFNVSVEKTVKVEMMKLDTPSFFRYSEAEQVQVLELPYEGKKVSMLILLPREGNDLASLESALSQDNLKMWKDSLRNQSVIVNIPKCKLETSYTLNEMLQEMGMSSAFDPDAADLTGMLAESEDLYIQTALHKAFVEVNEEGTEAAAATAVVVGTTSVQEYPVFRADRPFMFMIQDSETGNILFMGRVVDPTQS
jgi:serpin B